MSMYIENESVKVNIFIAKEDKPKAFKSLMTALNKKEVLCRIDDDYQTINSFWQLMEKVQWDVVYDKQNNIISLTHGYINVAEEDLVFEAIAPFVSKGSSIEYVRETDDQDRKELFLFDGITIEKKIWIKEYDYKSEEYWEEVDIKDIIQ